MDSNSERLDFALETAREVGQIHLNYFGQISSIKKKSSDNDLLTLADVESDSYIKSKIKQNYPLDSIVSEESDSLQNQSEYTWVIDPLDGTTNFAHNLPIFAVSIGLKKYEETVLGVVYNPAVNKCFYAEINKGAFLNGEIIHPSSNRLLSESLIATGFPYLHDELYDMSFLIFKELYDGTRGIRRLGAAALDLCFVAMGRFDAFYEFNLNPWDICAGSLIAKEAGCIVSDWNGERLPSDGSRILCTNKCVNSDMIKILSNKKYSIFY